MPKFLDVSMLIEQWKTKIPKWKQNKNILENEHMKSKKKKKKKNYSQKSHWSHGFFFIIYISNFLLALRKHYCKSLELRSPSVLVYIFLNTKFLCLKLNAKTKKKKNQKTKKRNGKKMYIESK